MLHASQPYARMLVRWITTGYLSDPYDEFMVKESGHITKGVLENDYTDEYWDRRYTVSRTPLTIRKELMRPSQLRDGSVVASTSKVNNALPAPAMASGVPTVRAGTNRLPGGACVPSFLQPWKFKILLAGKYLNVIRECGIEVKKVGEEVEEELVVLNDAK
jgi:gamma-tubulin complex component 2